MSKFVPENEDRKCAPSKKYNEGSCFTLESLTRMAAAFNIMLHKTKKYDAEPIVIKEDKKYLVEQLTIALKPVCSSQLCWLKQPFIKALNDAEINENTFLPKISQGRFNWLTTTNIEEKMKQYEFLYKDFKFVGCVPMDFDSIESLGIRDLDLDSLYVKGIRKLGFVFNLDYHNQSGSHWVSMFCNLSKNQIYYFDSCAKKPTKEVKALVNRIATWCYYRNVLKSRKKIPVRTVQEEFMDANEQNFIEKLLKRIKYNKIKHQRKNSECGVYSINFILRMAKGIDFDEICEHITDDDEMNECRKVYFRFE